MILGFAPIQRPIRRSSKQVESNPARTSMHEPRERILNLRDAMTAIHDGRWNDAETSLIVGCSFGDPRFLNLMGVVCQARNQWKQARRFFGKAMKADRNYAPAGQNMRRLYELHTFGHTDLPIALFDWQGILRAESRIAAALMRQ